VNFVLFLEPWGRKAIALRHPVDREASIVSRFARLDKGFAYDVTRVVVCPNSSLAAQRGWRGS
jgi:hypothetical protein